MLLSYNKFFYYPLCILFLFLSCSLTAAKSEYVTIGTGGISGVYYPTGGAICFLLNQLKSTDPIHCEIKSTAGSIYNISGLRSGELEVGVVQSDWQFHAYHGSRRYQEIGEFKSLRSLFSVHAEPFTVLARMDANIDFFEELKGKRINIGPTSSGQRATMNILLDLYGWKLTDFEKVFALNPSEQAQALCDDTVDAIIYVVGHPNSSIKEASGACQTKLVNVYGDKIDQLIANTGYYKNSLIPAAMYRGSHEDTKTFGVAAVITTTDKLSESAAYQMVKSVFENFDDFKQLHPVFNNLKKESMVSDALTAPLHPGAVRYYREVGLIK